MQTPTEQKPNYWTASQIAARIKEEGDAVMNQEQFLACLDPERDADLIADLTKIIIPDEKNHIVLYQKHQKHYDGIKADDERLGPKPKKDNRLKKEA